MVRKTKEQFLKLGLPIPRNRISIHYHNPVNTKIVYYHKSGIEAVKFKARLGKILEKRI